MPPGSRRPATCGAIPRFDWDHFDRLRPDAQSAWQAPRRWYRAEGCILRRAPGISPWNPSGPGSARRSSAAGREARARPAWISWKRYRTTLCRKPTESGKRAPEPATSGRSAGNSIPAGHTPLIAAQTQLPSHAPKPSCLSSFASFLPTTHGHFPSRFSSAATDHFGESRNDARVLARRRRNRPLLTCHLGT